METDSCLLERSRAFRAASLNLPLNMLNTFLKDCYKHAGIDQSTSVATTMGLRSYLFRTTVVQTKIPVRPQCIGRY